MRNRVCSWVLPYRRVGVVIYYSFIHVQTSYTVIEHPQLHLDFSAPTRNSPSMPTRSALPFNFFLASCASGNGAITGRNYPANNILP